MKETAHWASIVGEEAGQRASVGSPKSYTFEKPGRRPHKFQTVCYTVRNHWLKIQTPLSTIYLPIWARKPLRVVAPSAISIKFPFSVFFSKAGARNTSLSGREGHGHYGDVDSKERTSDDDVSLRWRARRLKGNGDFQDAAGVKTGDQSYICIWNQTFFTPAGKNADKV